MRVFVDTASSIFYKTKMPQNSSYVNLSHPQITVVDSLQALFNTNFTETSNVILYRPPLLTGDFNGLAEAIIDQNHYLGGEAVLRNMESIRNTLSITTSRTEKIENAKSKGIK